MAQIITVASGKGGVGKSTFCANIALAFSHFGKKILLVDGDAGFRTLDILTGVDKMVVYDWLDVIEKRSAPEKALLFCDDNIRLLPAPQEYPEDLTADAFKELICMYKDDYDFIFIDSPAGINSLMNIYAAVSDSAVILATPDEISARGAYSAGEALIKCGIAEDRLRLVINCFDRKAVIKGKLLNLDDMIDKTYIRLLGVIPFDRNISYSSVCGTSLNDKNGVKSAFFDIVKRLIGKETQLYL